MRLCTAILIILSVPSAFASWPGELPSSASSSFDQAQYALDLTNVLACQQELTALAKATGTDVQFDTQLHTYPNGYVCAKTVAKFATGKSCECYSASRIDCGI